MEERISRRAFVEGTGLMIAAAASFSCRAGQHEIRNEVLSLKMDSYGTQVVIADLKRGMSWELDPASRFYRPYREEYYQQLTDHNGVDGKLDLPKRELGQGSIVGSTPASIRLQFKVPEGTIEYLWKLADDHV